MGRSLGIGLVFLFVFSLYVWAHDRVWEERAQVRGSAAAGYVLPSAFNRIMALEYKGLLSSYQFLQVTTFFGERLVRDEGLTEGDWDYIVAMLESITDLDPYFLDAYIFGESILTWEAGRIESANRLLAKGMQYRSDDWLLPFYIGFNHFYFLKDFEQGAEYLMRASRLPDSPGFLPSLAARLGFYGNQSATAVAFLRSMAAQTSDPRLRERLETRVTALERAALIEEKVAEYLRDHGQLPADLSALVTAGYLHELPPDPYGGEWYLEDGRVGTTSRFVEGDRESSKLEGE